MPDLDSEALDFRAASESFASVRRIGRRDLEILRLVTDYHEHKALTGACREAGLAPPVFEEIGTRFRVTLFTERVGPSALDETDQAIVDALAGSKGLLPASSRAGSCARSARDRRTRSGATTELNAGGM